MSNGTDEELDITQRTRLRRFPIRGHFDRATINAILDAAPLAHIAFDHPGPAILPMVFWRRGNFVHFHGSARNRMFDALRETRQCCFVATLVDAFVLARAALHHSVNYRSVMIYGAAEEVTDAGPKMDALKSLIDRFYPGRWAKIRAPSPAEFLSVRVFRLPIVEASAKIRTGFPTPYAEDFGIPVWAGIVPVKIMLDEPQRDPNSAADLPIQDFTRLSNILQRAADGRIAEVPLSNAQAAS